MTFAKRMTTLWLSLLILALAACGAEEPGVPVTGETPSVTSTPRLSPGLPPEAVLNAQEWLATQFNVEPAQVQIIDMEQAEWTDSCLGLGRANESCAAVITPGWRVVFEVNGQSYEVRIDETGSTVRLASPEKIPGTGIKLEGTSWTLISMGGSNIEEPSPESDPITLTLTDGQVEGFGGCNSFGGTYQIDGNNISFDQITSTLRACADPQITEQEQRYLQALGSAGSYEFEGSQLRINYDDGARQLVFEAPFPGAPGPPETATPGG